MTDEYVRYADWLTISWMVVLSGVGVLILGLLGMGSSMASVTMDGPPFEVASIKVVASLVPTVVVVVGMSIVVYGAGLRSEAEALRPDGLEVPG